MEMKTLVGGLGEIVFLTHVCQEEPFVKSLGEVSKLDVVHELMNWMRAED